MLPVPIDNQNLQATDIPADTAEWGDIVRFAQTFNGYHVHGSFAVCGQIANERRHDTMTNLRTCLFFEQRRWNHFGRDPDGEAMEYIRSLLQKIRSRLPVAAGGRATDA
ncbi:MAG: hypothetical protein QM754_05445 [Tepidisphaeraceae bacterium]